MIVIQKETGKKVDIREQDFDSQYYERLDAPVVKVVETTKTVHVCLKCEKEFKRAQDLKTHNKKFHEES